MRAIRSALPIALALLLGACQAASGSHGVLSTSTNAVASPAPSVAPSPTPTPTPKVLKLVTMGASDVTGLGADDPATEGWAPVLATTLTGKADHVRLGFPGWTAKQIHANALDQAVKAQPDLVVLWTGVNDFNAGIGLEDFKQELGTLLAALAKTGAKVYVLNMPDLGKLPAFKAGATPLSLVVPVWQTAIRDTAEAHGATVVDLAPYSQEVETHPELISRDGFHPSTKGYQRLAAIIAAAIGTGR